MTRWLTAILAASALIASSGMARADDRLEFRAKLSGAQEVTTPLPGGVETDGEGKVKVDFDDALTKVKVRLRVEDLISDVAAAHFHCRRAGENGPVVFGLVSPGPCSFNDGRLRCTLTNEDLTDTENECEGLVGRPVTNIAALAFAMRDGLNLHQRPYDRI